MQHFSPEKHFVTESFEISPEKNTQTVQIEIVKIKNNAQICIQHFFFITFNE